MLSKCAFDESVERIRVGMLSRLYVALAPYFTSPAPRAPSVLGTRRIGKFAVRFED